jgi:tetratricopeptide (TPR) repeat protein
MRGMDKLIKKKLKFILVGFLIAIIPIGYLMYSSLLFENANKAFNEGNFSDDKVQIEDCIKEIDKALRVTPWSKYLNSWKSTLNLKIGNYREALDYALENDAYLYAGMIYEYLENPDSAKIYYKKSIRSYIKQLKKLDDTEALLVERQIALIYNFIGDSDKVNDYLKDIPIETNYQMRKLIHRYDYYIENYQSGGYKNFLNGNKICMKNDSISDKYTVDSLIDANRIYYDKYSSRKIKGQDERAVYEFKEIFKDKASSIGFIEIDCDDRSVKMNFN